MKMKDLENKKELGEVEEEKVAGGVIWPDYLYHPIKPDGEIEADTWTAQFDIIKQGVVSK